MRYSSRLEKILQTLAGHTVFLEEQFQEGGCMLMSGMKVPCLLSVVHRFALNR